MFWLVGVLTAISMVFIPIGSVYADSGNSCSPGTPPRGLGYYVVQKNENAASIAAKFHLSVADVLANNSGASFDRGTFILLPSTEAPGMWDNYLFCNATAQAAQKGALAAAAGIPVTGGTSGGATSQTVTTTCSTPGKPPAGLGYYVVGKGETVASIASKFQISQDAVTMYNAGASFNRGTFILLPAVEAPGMWVNSRFCGAH